MPHRVINNSKESSSIPALEQLAELVRQAEAKTRAKKIETETLQAAELFRAAEQRTKQAMERMRIGRTTCVRTLEKADHDEHLLKDLVRKLSMFKSSLSSEADAEKLITESRSAIESSRQAARDELEEMTKQLDVARRELRSAIDHYRPLRRELDRLQPELSNQFAADDRLLWDAEAHFPGGQLHLLSQEVEGGFQGFGSIGKHEQYARLKVWIGRFRYHQSGYDKEAEATEELTALSHRIFHQLKWLSRQFEPGYIEAFRQDFTTDWASYVEEAQAQLFQVLDSLRRQRDSDGQQDGHRDESELSVTRNGLDMNGLDDGDQAAVFGGRVISSHDGDESR